MKYGIIVYVILTALTVNGQSTILKFDNLEFKLPISLENAVVQFDLDSINNTRKGGVDERQILVHNDPISKDTIIGVTFYKRCHSREELKELHDKYCKNFEKKYDESLKSFDFSFFTSLTGKYYYLQAQEDLKVVIGDVMYNKADNNYVTITFLEGVKADELHKFLEEIY